MKKISSLIVCFALLAAGTAFALDLPDALKIPGLTVTGTAKTGLQVSGGTLDDFGKNWQFKNGRDSGAQDPSVYAYSDAISDGTPFRADLTLVWERDNLGVKTIFRYQPNNGPADGKVTTDANGNTSVTPATQDGRLGGTLNNLNNTIPVAFAYGYLWDKKIKVSAGRGTDAAWALFYSSFGDANVANFDGKDGIKVEVKPIDGLNVGAFYGTGSLFAKALTGGYSDQTKQTKVDTTLDVTDRRLVVGAKYESDLVSVVATTAHNFVESLYVDSVDYISSLPSTPNMNFIYKDAGYDVGRPIPNTSNLFVGVKVNPIDALQIDLSIAAINLGSKTWTGAYNGGEEIAGAPKKGAFNPFWRVLPKFYAEFAINEQLSAGLGISDIQFADDIYTKEFGTDDTEASGLGLFFPITISPHVGYALSDDLSLSLDLNFKINAVGSDQFGFGLKPMATFSLGSGATFVVYDEITLYTKSKYEDGTSDYDKKHPIAHQVGPLSGASGTTNTLQFDFVWTF
jgi:hypothetical protein